MIYIFADDLTGASDAGVQFSKNGYKTILVIINHDAQIPNFIPEKADVLVIDTETREVEEKIARLTLRKILKQFKLKKEDLIFKKIDSTLRGNVGAEIEVIMNISKKDFCILNPSFPSQRRITIGGYLIVQQKLLGFSEYSSEPSNPEENSYIPSLLKKQTNLKIAQIHLIQISKKQEELLEKMHNLFHQTAGIIVTDSINDGHLENITETGLKSHYSILFTGSAGMTQSLVKFLPKKNRNKKDLHKNQQPLLLIGGSRRTMMTKQIHFLKNKLPITELVINLEKSFAHPKRMLALYANHGIQQIKANHDLLIHTNPLDNREKSIDDLLMKKFHLNFRELEIAIKNFIGELTFLIIDQTEISNLMLTGGDIALSVCNSLGIKTLELVQEILPGIPLSLGCFQNRTLNIITKAGGFGTQETLYEIVRKFRNLANREDKNNHHEPEKI